MSLPQAIVVPYSVICALFFTGKLPPTIYHQRLSGWLMHALICTLNATMLVGGTGIIVALPLYIEALPRAVWPVWVEPALMMYLLPGTWGVLALAFHAYSASDGRIECEVSLQQTLPSNRSIAAQPMV